MKQPSKQSAVALVAVALFTIAGTSVHSLGQPQNQALRPARSRADETLAMWNEIGNKLIAMAQDFPEEKNDFKLPKDERSFAQNLLHVRSRLRPDAFGFRLQHRARFRQGQA